MLISHIASLCKLWLPENGKKNVKDNKKSVQEAGIVTIPIP